jgi:hypothetical protein
VTEQEREAGPGQPSRRAALVGTYAVAAVLGYLLGGPLAFVWASESSTPQARVGFALQQERLAAGPAEWAALRDDVQTVRAQWPTANRAAFDLVVAVRGLASDGNSDWAEAERLCRNLAWPRCDRPALEELARRSRP